MEHVLYTSFLGAGPDALSEHTQMVHWATEQADDYRKVTGGSPLTLEEFLEKVRTSRG